MFETLSHVSQKCVYSVGQHLFGMYFKTKQELILGCSIFENTIQWKVSLKDFALPLLLFRICEFIHNSSFTFPEGFFSNLEIRKLPDCEKLQGKCQFNYLSYCVISFCKYFVSHGHLETVLSLQRFPCPAFPINLSNLSRLFFPWGTRAVLLLTDPESECRTAP